MIPTRRWGCVQREAQVRQVYQRVAEREAEQTSLRADSERVGRNMRMEARRSGFVQAYAETGSPAARLLELHYDHSAE